MAVVIALSMAWSSVSNVYAGTADEPAEVHDRRRALLRDSARRAVAPE
ncbi:transcriptional regulator [Saccharothrix australiensis]|nr:transcriptional regulator [Saccharothrix australiensis]